ncbi:MAG: hypothetical protein GKR93_08180 [Gammaproteobacteria bacterium]|nr:hypothetical protein [Gammaproteobacteria bacterium]
MQNEVKLDEETTEVISRFFRRYEIRSLAVSKGLGITNQTEISDITMHLINDAAKPESDYLVEFKLQRECADIHHYLKSIQSEPTFSIELDSALSKKESQSIKEKLNSFVDLIRERVKSALKEQQVQNITYVGNTFILNNSTKFKVLSDEGEGRLNIEVLTKDKPLDALLTASGLLDGLYLGSIKLAES